MPRSGNGGLEVIDDRHQTPDVSVVIISWRMRDLLTNLLDSILAYTKDVRYEIIIVDNASNDGTSEAVRRLMPNAVIIENAVNRGVAAARNQGLVRCTGRYFMTLDADTYIQTNAIRTLVTFMDEHPDAGLAGGKLTFFDGIVQPSARRFPTPMAQLLRRLDTVRWAKESKSLKRHEMMEWDRSDSRPVDYVIGACQIFRREVYERIGPLDENIFYGPEDVDYCLRVQEAGWKVYFVATASFVHLEQRVTKRKLISVLTWRHLKGIFYIYWKYGGRLRVRTPRIRVDT